MNRIHIYATLIAAAAVSSPAIAQTPLMEVADTTMVAPFNANADTVDDWDVFLADGTKIGEVEEVLGTDRNTPTALAIDFDGNAGYANRDVVVPLTNLSLSAGRLLLNADPAAIQAMPAWDD